VDGEDVDQIARGLARLLNDPEEAERMGRNARHRVLENFIHQRRVAQLRDLAMKEA
jgi:glycosyltransferase involved in cell wall biosynthesis